MTISDIVATRQITELVHFTTNYGILGMLASGFVMPRTRLADNCYLEHIYKHNCPDRSRDREWHGHISLSISRINPDLFRSSSGHWHEGEGWWGVLSLPTSILADDSVVFTTTNNMYSGVKRAKGATGLEALFGPRIHRYKDLYANRSSELESKFTTCRYAEALYPVDIPVSKIKCIYLSQPEHVDVVSGMCEALGAAPVQCEVRPSAFV